MQSMYEILMSLPFFNGVSYNRVSEIVGSTPLAFVKYKEGEEIIHRGDACGSLAFVISGKVRVSIANRSDRFVVSQTLEAPSVIMPEVLFGRSTVYPCTVTAIDEVSVMRISKTDFTKLLNTDAVFLFNYLNTVATKAQKSVDGIMSLTTGSLEERLAFWVLSLTQRDAVDITLTCKQRDLYSMFGVQRMSFMCMLDDLTERGVLSYGPGVIKFKSRADLKTLLHARL